MLLARPCWWRFLQGMMRLREEKLHRRMGYKSGSQSQQTGDTNADQNRVI